MCSIFGLVNKSDEPVSYNILANMKNALIHRGPDQNDIFTYKNIGLGSTRLSIIDVENGKMPMHSSNNRYVISYNGEIYNHANLRKKYLSDTDIFKTKTDTETILKLYQKFDEGAFEYLNGMFAFAIFDKKLNKITICRDQLGQKPIYYYNSRNFFIFASEIKAIIKHPLIKSEVSDRGLSYYLNLGYCPSPYTLFKNIKKVPPGHYLSFKDNKITIKQYWKIKKYHIKSNISKSDMIKEVRKRVINSVENRLMSDVGSSIFLSGGVDSTVIAGITNKLLGKNLKTFSLGFSSKSAGGSAIPEEKKLKYNSDKYHANLFASLIKSQHEEVIFDYDEGLPRLFIEIVKQMDEPCYAPTILPLHILSKLVSKKFKVALTGDGGDELFGGYKMYELENKISKYNYVPKLVRENLYNLYKLFPISDKAGRFLEHGRLDSAALRYLSFKGIFPKSDSLLANKNINYNSTKVLQKFYDKQKLKNFTEIFMEMDISLWISDHTTNCFDKMSMLNSLETRSAYLDHDLVDFSQSIPLNFKIRGGNKKWILKEAFKDIIPQEILMRKEGSLFSPAGGWLRRNLRPLIEKFLSKEYIEKAGLVDANIVLPIVQNHYEGKTSSSGMLQTWSLLSLHVWYDIFILNPEKY